MAVLLVRHAVALPRRGWSGDDDLRPLSERGRRQADGLVQHLVSFHPIEVRSSPALRCVDTVAPFARAADRAVQCAAELAEGRGRLAGDVVRSLVDTEGHVVMCTHGDVIGDVLVRLAEDGARLDDDRCQKGSTWLIERARRGTIRARYTSPPS